MTGRHTLCARTRRIRSSVRYRLCRIKKQKYQKPRRAKKTSNVRRRNIIIETLGEPDVTIRNAYNTTTGLKRVYRVRTVANARTIVFSARVGRIPFRRFSSRDYDDIVTVAFVMVVLKTINQLKNERETYNS